MTHPLREKHETGFGFDPMGEMVIVGRTRERTGYTQGKSSDAAAAALAPFFERHQTKVDMWGLCAEDDRTIALDWSLWESIPEVVQTCIDAGVIIELATLPRVTFLPGETFSQAALDYKLALAVALEALAGNVLPAALNPCNFDCEEGRALSASIGDSQPRPVPKALDDICRARKIYHRGTWSARKLAIEFN